ncbi:MAG: hypothetical protein QOH89_1300 [Pseudonocardiales bacterium]|jgi:Arc/MetJ family transcription regulator|nr:hypothetical protein [Pseudonocardiales bacterium]
MRTTVRLDDDVAAAAQKLARERHISMSDAVNELARAGTHIDAKRKPFEQQTADMGLLIDVSNIGETLEFLEGPVYK